MKLKPLAKIIKSHYRRCCPLCGGVLKTDIILGNHRSASTKVQSRAFQCILCPSSYYYERFGNHFIISEFTYAIDKYEIHCYYNESLGRKIGYEIIYDPEPDKSYIDNEIIVKSDKLIPFPSTKEKIEDRLYMHITFS